VIRCLCRSACPTKSTTCITSTPRSTVAVCRLMRASAHRMLAPDRTEVWASCVARVWRDDDRIGAHSLAPTKANPGGRNGSSRPAQPRRPLRGAVRDRRLDAVSAQTRRGSSRWRSTSPASSRTGSATARSSAWTNRAGRDSISSCSAAAPPCLPRSTCCGSGVRTCERYRSWQGNDDWPPRCRRGRVPSSWFNTSMRRAPPCSRKCAPRTWKAW
jgi:hypothetical protein